MQFTKCRGQRLPNGSAHIFVWLPWDVDLGGTNAPLVVGLTRLEAVNEQVGRFSCVNMNNGCCIGALKV